MYSRSETSFLQCRNSVRLFASRKGPTCGMEEDRMRKAAFEVCCKTFIKVSADVAFLQYSTVDSALQHFSFSVFENIHGRKPYARVKQFLFSVIVLQQTSMKTLRMC